MPSCKERVTYKGQNLVVSIYHENPEPSTLEYPGSPGQFIIEEILTEGGEEVELTDQEWEEIQDIIINTDNPYI